ncbi:hypothetical protein GRI97_06160 [Altererythrobacter xixiisoli]|uniref:DOMON domain-containing protein n=2 Tax=Croceibacterium xixiisoli TaxID=1476466 RepID=A0A6I4TTE4_9SPHN|nr:hypothetical protein [Croceibacterium xixiisoli]
MIKWLLSAAAVLLAQPALLAAQDCTVERARYVLRVPDEEDQWQLAFIPARHMASPASDLYLRLTTPQRRYWFTLSVSQGYGGIAVLPVGEPVAGSDPRDLAGSDGPGQGIDPEILATLRLLAFDRELHVANDPPRAGDPAPHAIMLPELGQTLWYSPGALTEDPAAERDPMPRGLFRLAGCGAAEAAVGE